MSVNIFSRSLEGSVRPNAPSDVMASADFPDRACLGIGHSGDENISLGDGGSRGKGEERREDEEKVRKGGRELHYGK